MTKGALNKKKKSEKKNENHTQIAVSIFSVAFVSFIVVGLDYYDNMQVMMPIIMHIIMIIL